MHIRYSAKVKGSTCSVGLAGTDEFDTPEAFARCMVTEHLAPMEGIEPTDTLQVWGTVFGKKNSRSRMDSVLGEVLIAEYPANNFLTPAD